MCWTPHFRTKDLKCPVTKTQQTIIKLKRGQKQLLCLSREAAEKWTLFLSLSLSVLWKRSVFRASYSLKRRRRFTRCVTENGRGPQGVKVGYSPVKQSTNYYNNSRRSVVCFSLKNYFATRSREDDKNDRRTITSGLSLLSSGLALFCLTVMSHGWSKSSKLPQIGGGRKILLWQLARLSAAVITQWR